MEEAPDIQSVLMKLESSLPICRVCLDISMEYIEFEGPLCVVNGEEITYSEGFYELSPPATSELPDKSPSYFCVTCGNDLLNAYLFLKRVENANFILHKVKCLSEEKSSCIDRKEEECISGPENDDCTENLKVELLIDEENDLKSLQSIPEESIKMENQVDSARECKMIVPHDDVDIKSYSQHEDLESAPDSLIESMDDDLAENCNVYDEGAIWICDECGEIFDSQNVLIEHRKKHKSKDRIIPTCSACDRIFSTREQLDDHLLFHQYSQLVPSNSDKMFHKCTLCKKNCRTEDELVDHINVHRGTKPHTCNICSNTFHTKNNLQLHKWRMHTSRDPERRKGNDCEKCKHCQRVVRKSHMEKHLEAHSAPKLFTCSVCGKQLATKFGLKAHSVAHKQREYVCHLCDKICLTDFTLRKHIQYIHLSDRKKYQCEDCGLVFQYPSYLKDHQRQHNVKNRFQCPHCDRSYCRKPQLDIHMRYHNNDFRYKCDQCDKCYVTKSNLTDHIRSRHTKITYDCDKCHQKFKSMTGLRKHKYTHTGYPYNCPLCSVGQTSRSGMKAHLFGVHRDAVTEEEFNEMFPIIIPKSGYRRPRAQL